MALTANRLFVLFIIGMSQCLAVSSCSNNPVNGIIWDPPARRGLTVLAFIRQDAQEADTPAHGADIPEYAPCRVSLLITIGLDEADPLIEAAISKVEINQDDGSGWIDITGWFMEHWSTNSPTPRRGYEFSYQEPGTYFIRARVTYWDGEVLYDDAGASFVGNSQTVTVLPPEEA